MIKVLDKIDFVLRKVLIFTAGVFLVAILILTCANIVMRRFGLPIQGTFELTGLFGAITAAAVLGFTQTKKDNIAVDILVNYFPPAMKKYVAVMNNAACAAFSLLAAWEITKIGLRQLSNGEVTETLRIIPYPFVFISAFGFAALALVFIIDLIKNFATAEGDKK
jgi:TRAP-type C4-dicarboxylate transport system permease small subunit